MTISSEGSLPVGSAPRPAPYSLSEHLEVERKYDVPEELPWMDLTTVPEVAGVERLPDLVLDAVYFDTASDALARAGLTLRRREGGTDAGWTLKRPAGRNARTELSHPLGVDDEAVPDSLMTHVVAWSRNQPVVDIASLHTYRLFDVAGVVLAEAVDDRVRASSDRHAGSAADRCWREWEIELVHGSDHFPGAADRAARRAGATRSAWSSKLARALDRRAPGIKAHRLNLQSPSGAVIIAHFGAQLAIALVQDGAVRTGDWDAIHNMRVAVRHLRGVLATFRPLFRTEVTEPVRSELTWLGGALGAVRDAGVQRQHLLQVVADEPSDLVMGPVAERIEAQLRGDERTAAATLSVVLSSLRYFALLESLDSLVADPPLTRLAEEPAGASLISLVGKSWKRLHSLVTAEVNPEVTGRDLQLHNIRKAAKSVRYACEAVQPVFRKPAAKMAATAELWQSSLGEHQDSVVARQTLRGLGVRMFLDGQNSFTIGRLHALEQARAETAERQFLDHWPRGSKGRTMLGCTSENDHVVHDRKPSAPKCRS